MPDVCPLCGCETALTIGCITYPDLSKCAGCLQWADWSSIPAGADPVWQPTRWLEVHSGELSWNHTADAWAHYCKLCLALRVWPLMRYGAVEWAD